MVISTIVRATLEKLFTRNQKYVKENSFSIVLSM
jgi:hypothetical protein